MNEEELFEMCKDTLGRIRSADTESDTKIVELRDIQEVGSRVVVEDSSTAPVRGTITGIEIVSPTPDHIRWIVKFDEHPCYKDGRKYAMQYKNGEIYVFPRYVYNLNS